MILLPSSYIIKLKNGLHQAEWILICVYIYVPAQSRAHIRHEWPGPVGTLIQAGIAWAVHDGYDIIN